ETRKDRPKLSDLRESGSIEQDADVVILLSREDQLRPDNEKAHYKNVVNVDVAKHRNGPVGLVQLHFRENSASFENFIDRQDSPQ
ncbi:MAG: DnaB-like helicase C-terminal domain-containing protein, partial [Patescibacteria group bacterium]